MSTTVQPAVHVNGVSKSFRVPREHVHTLKEKALHPFRRPGHDVLNALRDVSFSVAPGEFFGIVGRNGSGKSTLLKCLAGIYRTDRGRIYVDGRVSTFIELGVGFNPDLAAYDNVMLNATMLGLPTREGRKRFDAIMDFAELREFTDLKLKNYSSGMLVRLAFSVMIQVDADILLIDEVLAVGDAAFQQKCYDEFGRIRARGATVLLVTHDMAAVQRFCDRALLLERGRKVELGATDQVADRYLQLNFSQEARVREATQAAIEDGEVPPPQDDPAESEPSESGATPWEGELDRGEPLRISDGTAEIIEGWFEDREGHRTDVLHTREPCSFHARIRIHERLEDPIMGLSLFTSQGEYAWGANNRWSPPAGILDAGEEIVFSVAFENFLAPDRYAATAAIHPNGGVLRWADRRNRLASVMVTGRRESEGLVEVPFEFRLRHADRGPVVEQEVSS
jgi:ABC-type polysaccharide/polyol phosphate transport system ATPase subunit